MNDEMATRLAQELLDAADEDARARVVVRWLPDFARCQVTTAARVKALCADVKALGAKMDEYHAPAQKAEATAEDPRTTRLKLILAFAQKNWQSIAILVILVKALGLTETVKELLGLLN